MLKQKKMNKDETVPMTQMGGISGKNLAFHKSLKITCIYLLVGCLWIVFSDLITHSAFHELDNMAFVNIVKGVFYVTVTAALIFSLIYQPLKKAITAQENVLTINSCLEMTNKELTEEQEKLIESEKKLRDSEQSKTVLLSNLPGMAYRCRYDPERIIEFVSQGCLLLTGYSPEDLMQNKGKSYYELMAPNYRDAIRKKWVLSLMRKEKFQEEYEIITACGEVRWVLEQGQGLYDDNGNVLTVEGLIIDITERKQQEMKLKYLSEHDPMTGLYNRTHFEEVLFRELTTNAAQKNALLLVTLNKFGLVNLTHGYAFGEALIREAARQMARLCAADCRLFQIASDRFAFYIRGYAEKAELEDLCVSIVETLDACLSDTGVRGHVGVLELECSQTGADNALKHASIAAEYADESITSRYCFFDREMEAALSRKELIKTELAKSIRSMDDSCLYLEYQPIINSDSSSIHGFEALARFAGETVGKVSPGEFIPIAEEAQLIVPLGKSIMKQAFAFLKRLENEGFGDIMLSINISAIQLVRDDFLPDLLDSIAQAGIRAQNIDLEITESVFSDNYRKINEKLGDIKANGISISIDDFGTGYSSLARVNELNINCLKIDKQFIDRLPVMDPREVISGDIISMAHKLGHTVVAEGVELMEQRQYLLDHGCDYLQGYLFSRPLPEDKAIALLVKGPASLPQAKPHTKEEEVSGIRTASLPGKTGASGFRSA